MRRNGLACVLLLAVIRSVSSLSKPGHVQRISEFPLPSSRLGKDEGEALRPGYHITAQTGWLNDPNGPFEYRNITHMFFQWYPFDAVWGPPYWGHVISKDLVFWKHLPAALIPDTVYDVDGVFSGSAAVLPDGTPILLYTGASKGRELKSFFYQVQAIALPVDLNDPEMIRWIKSPANPLHLDLPHGGTHTQFRDPITPIVQDGRFWTVFGGQVYCVGSAILYSSSDLYNWRLEGELGNQIGVGEVDGKCPLPKDSNKPKCEQMGEDCRSWECPDFFALDHGIYVLKWSDQVVTREPFAADWYVLSSIQPDLEEASSVNKTLDPGVFVDTVEGVVSPPRIIDYGAIYASKTWEAADGRRLWTAWIFETAIGCYQQCSHGSPFTKQMGWQGALTIPRAVTYDPASETLLFNPVAEITKLRTIRLYSGRPLLNTSRSSGEAQQLAETGDLVQSELIVNFSISSHSSPAEFATGGVVAYGGAQHSLIYINGTVDGANVTKAFVYIDNTLAGGHTNASIEGGEIPLPAGGLSADDLKLHVLFDRSIFEIFALGGRARITSRVYPAGILAPTWTLSLYGSVTGAVAAVSASAEVWQMSSCWITDLS